MKQKSFILAFFAVLAMLFSCKKEEIQPVTTVPTEPQIDMTQRMGRGELFDKLITIPGISDIKAVKGVYHSTNFDEEYQFFLEQNIDAENPAVGTFKQKMRIGHVSFDKNVVLVTEGYSLGDYNSAKICENSFENLLTKDLEVFQGEEIANHLESNMLVVEHRYFYSSNPANRDWKYLTTKNASADLHNIFEKIKPLYKKPWVATGVSKGGMTTMYYHMTYPNDVEVCVPYVTPMCNSLNDDRARDYIKEKAGTPEERADILACKKWLINFLKNNLQACYTEYRKQWNDKSISNNEILSHFLSCTIGFDADMWNYGNNWAFTVMPTKAPEYQTVEWVVNWFAKIKLTEENRYGSNFESTHGIIIDPTNEETFSVEPQLMRVTVNDTSTITGFPEKNLPYYYMAAREQGTSCNYGYNDIADYLPEEWKEICNNLFSQNTEKTLALSIKGVSPSDVPTYTPELYNRCINYYKTHDDRMIFIYGGNDFWTGCGINDVWKDKSDRTKYPTFGFDTKQQMAYYLVPNHGHESLILHLSPNEQQEIWNKIDTWLAEGLND